MDDPSKKRRLPFALDPGPWDALPGGSVATALVPRSARVDGISRRAKAQPSQMGELARPPGRPRMSGNCAFLPSTCFTPLFFEQAAGIARPVCRRAL